MFYLAIQKGDTISPSRNIFAVDISGVGGSRSTDPKDIEKEVKAVFEASLGKEEAELVTRGITQVAAETTSPSSQSTSESQSTTPPTNQPTTQTATPSTTNTTQSSGSKQSNFTPINADDDFLRGFNADDREAQVRFQPHPYTPPQTTTQAASPSAEYKSLKLLNNRGITQVTADDFLRGFNEGYEDELPTQTSADVRRLASFDDDFRRGFWSDYGDEYKSMVTMNEAQREFEWLQKYLVPGNVQFYDFEDYARKGAEIQNPSMSEAEGYGNFFGWHPGAEAVGNIVTFSRDNWEAIADAEMDRREVPGRSLYHYMTEDEVDIYNYLLAKRGNELAQLYLDSLEEMLNQRYGTTVAGRITDIENPVGNAVMTGLYGVSAGLDQYVSGVKQAFSEEELPTSVTQYGSQYIRNDLQQDGNGLGLLAYDTVTTTSQMAPTILVSAIFGPEAGAVSQGFSATGNAYKQALSDGYSKEQAKNYATLVGTSEATLQYLLGGISKLGGTNAEQLLTKVAGIDNALLRVAAAAGIKIGSEVTEEELQLFLEPLYRTLVFGEDYSAPAMEEILYTALLTVTTTGILEGGNIASYSDNDIKALVEQSKEQVKADGEKSLQSGSMPDDAHLEIMGLNDPTARGMMAIYEMVNMEDADSNQTTEPPIQHSENDSKTKENTLITSQNVVWGSNTKSTQKLSNQIKNRGWTEDLVRQTIDAPYTTRVSINKATGNAATVFYTQQGAYVIVDDVTKEIVQISDSIDPKTWIPDPSIIDPYIPK